MRDRAAARISTSHGAQRAGSGEASVPRRTPRAACRPTALHHRDVLRLRKRPSLNPEEGTARTGGDRRRGQDARVPTPR